MPTPKQSAYPIFHECLNYTLDPYWRQVFEDCARGKFPKGSGIDSAGNAVYFKGKDTQWHQLSQDPEELYSTLKDLFQTELSLRSNKDRKDIRVEIQELRNHLESQYTGTWASIRKKSIKDALVRNFVLELKSNYSLTDEVTLRLHRLLQLGFLFNWIPPECVEYTDRQIVEISNLYHDSDTGDFELDTTKNKKIKRDFVPKAGKLSTLWKKKWESTRNKYAKV